MLPRVLALNDYFLDPGYLLSVLQSIQINPGEAEQRLHHDDGFCNMPRPRRALGTGVIAALDDFTAENGATCMIPGSHTWGDRRGEPSETIPIVMPAGSVAFFLSTTWHGGGQNSTSKPRRSILVQYCQPYIRPIENQFLAVDPRKLDEMPEQIVDMMGYQLHNTFIGYVSALHLDNFEYVTDMWVISRLTD